MVKPLSQALNCPAHSLLKGVPLQGQLPSQQTSVATDIPVKPVYQRQVGCSIGQISVAWLAFEYKSPGLLQFLFGGRTKDVILGVFHQAFRNLEIGVNFILMYSCCFQLFLSTLNCPFKLCNLIFKLFLHQNGLAERYAIQQ